MTMCYRHSSGFHARSKYAQQACVMSPAIKLSRILPGRALSNYRFIRLSKLSLII